MKILIVEDEAHIADGLRFNIEAEGFEAEIAADGESGLLLAQQGGFDAVVLDVMLPGKDGFEVARTLRENGIYVPILMLTARGRPEDVLNGFEAGADDYLPKPFDLNIFLARLNGLLRRREWSRRETTTQRLGDTFEINGKTIDFANLELRSEKETIHLTMMEIKLLRYLIEHQGQTVSRSTILEDVWGLQEDTDTRAIDNFIVRLRKYLEDKPNDPQIVRTVRGVGYKFVSGPSLNA
ncbi:MAG TPA: response regulator transcription factor [Pyrinomonadaceae bacterium]|nr:response regulator transcription factor [Pyrinomonadaceae bacterium]